VTVSKSRYNLEKFAKPVVAEHMFPSYTYMEVIYAIPSS